MPWENTRCFPGRKQENKSIIKSTGLKLSYIENLGEFTCLRQTDVITSNDKTAPDLLPKTICISN